MEATFPMNHRMLAHPNGNGKIEHTPTALTEQRLNELQIGYYERLEASVHDLLAFFGGEADQIVSVSWRVNVMDLLMTQRALAAVLEGWRIVRETRYSYRAKELVERYAVEVAPKQYDFLLREGRQFWEGPDGRRFATDIWIDEDSRTEESEITFNIPRADHAWLCELLPRLEAWRDRNHFLRGQAFNGKGEFMDLAREVVAWEDVILPPALRDAIQRNCIDLLAHGELYRANGVPLKRGIILHGPPGTGKTMIGKALARLCRVTFILVTPGMLDETADVRRIFGWARRYAPTILFFEDFDLIAGDRHSRGQNEILGEFLSGLDGVDSSEGIITIATTNNLHAIEPALKDRPNRIDCVLEVPAMRKAEREEFLRRWLERHGGDFSPAAWAGRTRGFTGAKMGEFCRLAVFDAVEERIRQGQTAPERAPLTDDNFRRALEKFPRHSGKAKIGFVQEDED